MKKLLAAILAAATAVTMVGCAASTPGGKVTLPEETGSAVQATALAAPVRAEQPQYPMEDAFYDEKTGEWDDEAWSEAYSAWRTAYDEKMADSETTMDGMAAKFRPLLAALLADSRGQNRVCSPLNVYLALAMLAECTDGESRAQILSALGEDSVETLRTRTKALWNENTWDDGHVTSLLANSLWLRDGYDYKQETLDRLASEHSAASYSGEMGSEAYNEALRAWINENTGDLLQEQAEGLSFDANTVLALASTIYYSANWSDKFSDSATSEDTFHAKSGDLTCDFMHSSDSGTVYYGDGFSAIGLSMDGSGRIWLLRPDDDTSPEELLQADGALDFLLANGQWSQSQYAKIELSLPKFDVASDMDLSAAMRALGITDVFGDAADFSPVTDADKLVLSKAEHAARVKIDEDGCEAAAYTVLIMEATAAPSEPQIVEFKLDRPFLFLLTGLDGAPLFAGIVEQPV